MGGRTSIYIRRGSSRIDRRQFYRGPSWSSIHKMGPDLGRRSERSSEGRTSGGTYPGPGKINRTGAFRRNP
jgi:hypothetical protein